MLGVTTPSSVDDAAPARRWVYPTYCPSGSYGGEGHLGGRECGAGRLPPWKEENRGAGAPVGARGRVRGRGRPKEEHTVDQQTAPGDNDGCGDPPPRERRWTRGGGGAAKVLTRHGWRRRWGRRGHGATGGAAAQRAAVGGSGAPPRPRVSRSHAANAYKPLAAGRRCPRASLGSGVGHTAGRASLPPPTGGGWRGQGVDSATGTGAPVHHGRRAYGG